MPSYVKDGGVFKPVAEIYIKDSGTWKTVLDGYVNDNGTWKSFLYEAGTESYTDYGTFSFIVPAGVYSIEARVIGGGGGSGANNQNGDAWYGAGGGAGGLNDETISVTPKETLTIIVGERGYGATYRFNTNYSYNYDDDGNQIGAGNGTAGETSYIRRGSTDLVTATGGGGGGYPAGNSNGGAGGTPQDLVSSATAKGDNANLSYTNKLGGTNGTGTAPLNDTAGTGYGNGGGMGRFSRGVNGQNGAIILEW
jgi:hypothetical protein